MKQSPKTGKQHQWKGRMRRIEEILPRLVQDFGDISVTSKER